MLHLGDNIKTIRRFLNLTQAEFAKKFNVKNKKNEFSADKIYTYESGVTIPPDEILEDIAKSVGLTLDELKNEKISRGDINLQKYTVNEVSSMANEDQPYWKRRQEQKNEPKEIYFPVYNGNARLREDDKLVVYNDDPEMQLPVGFLPQHLFPGCDHAEKAFGNSMYPRIANQAVVAGKILEKERLVFNELYGLHLKGGSPPVIKWVQACDEDPDCILLVSENKDLKPQKIRLSDIDFAFRIIYIINPA